MSTQFTVSTINKALETRPWVYKHKDKYRVVPRTSDHGKYEVTVSYNSEGNPEVEDCRDWRTKKPCLGFFHSRGNCYHSAALLARLMSQRAK